MSKTITKSPSKVWVALLWIYLFVLYFSAVFQLLLASSGLVSLAGFKNTLLYTLPWLLIPLLFPQWVRPLFAVLKIVLLPLALMNIGYFMIYKQEMSQGAIFSFFATSTDEAAEFWEAYYGGWVPAVVIGYSLPAFWLWHRIRPVNWTPKARVIVTCLALLPLAEPYLKYWDGLNTTSINKASSKLMGRLESVNPWQLLIAYQGYRRNLEEVNRYVDTIESSLAHETVTLNDRHPQQTHVLIIGESTNSQRMGIYGYSRDTTPRLSAVKDKMLAFEDVITPRPYTIEALSQVLTFADQAAPEKALTSHNVISMMKAAGFKTWWITNQQTVSDRNTTLTALSKQADMAVYLNNNRLQSASQYDDVVLEPFKDAMADHADKKFIVVHLLGTHSGYHHRYPQEFAKFSEPPSWKKSLDWNHLFTYNAYDNAVLYNDYIVSTLFESFKDASNYGAAIYLADHGEEVFDIRNFKGRDEYNPTTAMYTVPLLVYPTDTFKQARNGFSAWNTIEQRPYSTEHFIHTLCQLVDLQYNACDTTKSIISPVYTALPRIVGNPQDKASLRDYDVMFTQQMAKQENNNRKNHIAARKAENKLQEGTY